MVPSSGDLGFRGHLVFLAKYVYLLPLLESENDKLYGTRLPESTTPACVSKLPVALPDPAKELDVVRHTAEVNLTQALTESASVDAELKESPRPRCGSAYFVRVLRSSRHWW